EPGLLAPEPPPHPASATANPAADRQRKPTVVRIILLLQQGTASFYVATLQSRSKCFFVVLWHAGSRLVFSSVFCPERRMLSFDDRWRNSKTGSMPGRRLFQCRAQHGCLSCETQIDQLPDPGSIM